MKQEEAKEYAKKMTYRDAVYNALQGKCIPYRKATLIKLYELLDKLSSVTPTRKKAKWEVLEKHSDGTTRCRCTKCKNTMNLSIHTFDCFNFCPNCGAKMERGE